VVGPYAGAGEECEVSSPSGFKMWQGQRVMNLLQPHSPYPCAAGREEVEKIGNEVEPGKEGGMGGRCFRIWFYFSLSCSDLISNKLN